MKRLLFGTFLAAFGLLGAMSVQATTYIKQNNTTALNSSNSWGTTCGGAAAGPPTSADIVRWDNCVTGANNPALGADVNWLGIVIADPGGLVTIGTGGSLLNLFGS